MKMMNAEPGTYSFCAIRDDSLEIVSISNLLLLGSL